MISLFSKISLLSLLVSGCAYNRYHIETYLGHLLFEHDKKKWKSELSIQLIELGINYLRWNHEFSRQLFQRLFDELLDAINPHRDSSKSGLEK